MIRFESKEDLRILKYQEFSKAISAMYRLSGLLDIDSKEYCDLMSAINTIERIRQMYKEPHL